MAGISILKISQADLSFSTRLPSLYQITNAPSTESKADSSSAMKRCYIGHSPIAPTPTPRGDIWDTTAFDLAAATQPVGVARLILSYYDVDTGNANALCQAASMSGDRDQREMMAFLLDEVGMDINALSTFGHLMNERTGDENGTPLHAAVGSAAEEGIMFLLERGADIKKRNVMGMTPLECATAYGYETGRRVLEEWAGDAR